MSPAGANTFVTGFKEEKLPSLIGTAVLKVAPPQHMACLCK
jgi:hypothetical protein